MSRESWVVSMHSSSRPTAPRPDTRLTQNFRELRVWQKAHRLAVDVYQITAGFPRDEQYGLTSQIRRASISISANIAEGCGRGGRVEIARFLQMARGSASELECELLLARDLGFLSDVDHDQLALTIEAVQKMLTAFRQTLLARPERSTSTPHDP